MINLENGHFKEGMHSCIENGDISEVLDATLKKLDTVFLIGKILDFMMRN